MRSSFLLFICLLLGSTCFAQNHRNEFGFETDNDSYLANGSDRYYTNGLFIFYRHALPVKTADTAKLANKILGFEIGQKMYNPQSGAIPAAIFVDRPFAGYLYVGSTLNLLYKDESNLKLGAQIGMVGPASLAQAAQEGTHRLLGLYKISGWQYQIKNDPELNLSAEYNRLLARAEGVDISLAGYANLGNGFTGAGVGPLLRVGAFNRLFHSVSTQSTAAAASKQANDLHKNEFFVYYKPQINWVGFDATIQGGLLESHNDYTSDEIIGTPERWILSNQFGAAFSTNRFTFDLSVIFHTRDTKQMVQSHQWGTAAIIYRFD